MKCYHHPQVSLVDVSNWQSNSVIFEQASEYATSSGISGKIKLEAGSPRFEQASGQVVSEHFKSACLNIYGTLITFQETQTDFFTKG